MRDCKHVHRSEAHSFGLLVYRCEDCHDDLDPAEYFHMLQAANAELTRHLESAEASAKEVAYDCRYYRIANERLQALVDALKADNEELREQGNLTHAEMIREWWGSTNLQGVSTMDGEEMEEIAAEIEGNRADKYDALMEAREKHINLYHAINKLMLEMGLHGHVDTQHDVSSDVMDSLHAIDEGVYKTEYGKPLPTTPEE